MTNSNKHSFTYSEFKKPNKINKAHARKINKNEQLKTTKKLFYYFKVKVFKIKLKET